MKKRLMICMLSAFALTQCKEDCMNSDRCKLAPDPGFCRANIPRYYYDSEAKECKRFIWGGCDGVVPFETLEECKKQCGCK